MIFVCSEFSSLGFDASLGVVTKKRRNSHFFQGRTPLPSPNHRPSAFSLSLSLSLSLSKGPSALFARCKIEIEFCI